MANAAGGQIGLREYVDLRFRILQEIIENQIKATLASTEKQQASLDIRLQHMNEFRDQMRMERQDFASREHVESLQKWVDRAGGRAQVWSLLAVAVSILTALLVLARTVGLVK
jgi:hypothetical protein